MHPVARGPLRIVVAFGVKTAATGFGARVGSHPGAKDEPDVLLDWRTGARLASGRVVKSLQYLLPLTIVSVGHSAHAQEGTVQVLGPEPTQEVTKRYDKSIAADSTVLFPHAIGLHEMWIYEFEWAVQDGGGTLYWYASDYPLPEDAPMPRDAVEVDYISPLAPSKVRVTLNNPAYRRKYLHFYIRATEDVPATAIRFDGCRREAWKANGYTCP